MTRIMNRHDLMPQRRELRKDTTLAEKHLWELLRKGNVEDVKLRRQFSVKDYILDFYSPSIRLAIEIDGSIHDSDGAPERDSARQQDVEMHHIEFLRFSNDEVLRDTKRVMEVIVAKVKERIISRGVIPHPRAPHPSPLPSSTARRA